MAIAKVILNGETLMDVTSDTVESSKLLTGETATKNDGTKITGSYSMNLQPLTVKSTNEEQVFDGSPIPTEINGAILEEDAMTSDDSNILTSSLVWRGSQPKVALDTDAEVVIGQTYYLSGWFGTGETEETAQRIFFDIVWTASENLVSIPFTTRPGYDDGHQDSFDGSIEFTDIKLSTTQIVITATAPFVVYTNFRLGIYLSVSEIGEAYDGYLPVKVKPVKLRSTIVSPTRYGYDLYPEQEPDIVYESLSAITIVSASNWNDFGGDIFESLLPDTDYIIDFAIRNGKGSIVAHPNRYVFQLDENPVVLNLTNKYGDEVGTITIDGTRFKIDSAVVSDGYTIDSFQICSPIDGFSKVTVNAAPLQSKTIIPTNSIQGVVADNGYYGLSQVTVNAIPSAYLIPSGTYSISSNGTYNISQYASVDVSVEGGGKELLDAYFERTLSLDYENTNMTNIMDGTFYEYKNSSFSIYCPNVKTIYSSAFFGASIKNVCFPNVKSISESAFAYTSIRDTNNASTPLEFPSVTSLMRNSIFYNARIGYLSFPELLSAGNGTFYSCTCHSIYAPKLKSIGSSCFCNTQLTRGFSFPELEFASESAFARIWTSGSIILPKLKTASNGLFFSASRLESIDLPLVSSVGINCFKNCYSLSSISMPAYTHSWITNQAFAYCSALSSISFSTVYNIASSAFMMCVNLSRVVLSGSISSTNQYLCQSIFASCYRLKELYLLVHNDYLYGAVFNLSGTNQFMSTPIDGYTEYTDGAYGTIFVPSRIYSRYTTYSAWSSYLSRIVSLTDEEIAALEF